MYMHVTCTYMHVTCTHMHATFTQCGLSHVCMHMHVTCSPSPHMYQHACHMYPHACHMHTPNQSEEFDEVVRLKCEHHGNCKGH